MDWLPIDTAPKTRRPFSMFVVIALDVLPASKFAPYTTDPYCVWRDAD